jgi:hypothetical protein
MNIAKGRLDQFIKWLVSKFSNDEIVTDDNANDKVALALASQQAIAEMKRHFVFRTTTTLIGSISAGGTKWVTLNKPSTALFHHGSYIFNSGNTRCNIYSFSATSIAVCNMGSSATGSDLKIDTYWICWE